MAMIGDGPLESGPGLSSGGELIEDGRRSDCFCSIGACSCAGPAGVRARMAVSRLDSSGRTGMAGVGAVPEGSEGMFGGVIVVVEIGGPTIT